MLTAAQHAEIIKTHWKLLWPLPHHQRMKVLDELLADAEFEAELNAVAEAVSEPVEFASCVSTSSITSEVSSLSSSALS